MAFTLARMTVAMILMFMLTINDNRHLLRKSTVALLCRDIPLCSLPDKVTFLLLGVYPLAELISAVHLRVSNKSWSTLAWMPPLVNLVENIIKCEHWPRKAGWHCLQAWQSPHYQGRPWSSENPRCLPSAEAEAASSSLPSLARDTECVNGSVLFYILQLIS